MQVSGDMHIQETVSRLVDTVQGLNEKFDEIFHRLTLLESLAGFKTDTPNTIEQPEGETV